MTQEEFNQLAKDIFANNIYLTLATSGDRPWASPLFFCRDDKYNLCFISQLDSVHTQNILKSGEAAFAIFDSHAEEGKGNGIQGFGIVKLLEGDDIVEGLNWYHTSFIEMKPEILAAPNPYRLFKLTPSELYVLDPEATTDKRVKVEVL